MGGATALKGGNGKTEMKNRAPNGRMTDRNAFRFCGLGDENCSKGGKTNCPECTVMGRTTDHANRGAPAPNQIGIDPIKQKINEYNIRMGQPLI